MTHSAILVRPCSEPGEAPRPKSIGLRFDANTRFDEWIQAGQRIGRLASGSAWSLGDWMVFGERAYGRRYREALETTQLDYQTLRNYAWVARRFEYSRRREALSFQHHAEVAVLTHAEQDLWLGRAEAQGWSRNELRRQLVARRENRHVDVGTTAIVRLRVAPECEQRWRAAAAAADRELVEWLREVTDAAAEAELR